MKKIFKTFEAEMRQLSVPEKDCWISLVKPTERELAEVAEQYSIEPDDLRAALDEEERSRIELEDNYTLILVDIPAVEKSKGKDIYTTEPLGIILVKDAIITVCLEETPVLYALKQKHANELRTHMRTRFVLQILYRNASLYLQYLRVINKLSDKIEQKLHVSTENRELIELLELEKSLVYFTTSLRSNEVVLEKLLKSDRVKKYPEDEDLLEDVIVENRQAIEMSNIYSGILSGMMDAFASVISNNLNIVMKFLAVMTIVLAVPSIIFGAYGMNLAREGMPFSDSPFGFLIIVLISLAVSIVVAFYLAKKKKF
ncbi:MAG: magnesium transporter CorA family protein [Eubacteriales bacterium]|jgi:magnesium transporter|nr:magnesium transporter CorA family protein [Eubacteriales bacterium]